MRHVNVTDATLVNGVLGGDRSAFAELYDRRARVVRAVCFDTTRDFHAAADLTQEVFLRAFRNLGSLRDPERFAAWLTGIARQVCREWRRGRLRDRRRFQPLTGDVPSGAADDPADDRIAFLREALSRLPERERFGIQAFYLQGLDVEQARTALGMSRTTLYRVLYSARTRLREVLTRQEVSR